MLSTLYNLEFISHVI